MILDGKLIAQNMKNELINQFVKYKGKYIAIFLLGDFVPSQTYVKLKKEYGEELGVSVIVFGDLINFTCDNQELNYLNTYLQKEFINSDDVIDTIDFLNKDDNCMGVMVQLPLPKNLVGDKAKILNRISPKKDMDGLGGILFGLNATGLINFYPATPASVMKIFDYYKLDDFDGKNVVIIGQSNLIGKPLATILMDKGAEVISVNDKVNQGFLQKICLESDIIISATGVANLIDDKHIRKDNSQIIIDIGWGKIDGKIHGDVNYEKVKNKVKAITPVPGGVGPVTIASIFQNIINIQNQISIIEKYL
ncbi:MAG: bifunctional 5,10-methylenetetrahydrofolate dehydrogenase/5,10-methenyltetrahydrofolate cyclohydrolase [Candidatus Absconditabacteria bacterium]